MSKYEILTLCESVSSMYLSVPYSNWWDSVLQRTSLSSSSTLSFVDVARHPIGHGEMTCTCMCGCFQNTTISTLNASSEYLIRYPFLFSSFSFGRSVIHTVQIKITTVLVHLYYAPSLLRFSVHSSLHFTIITALKTHWKYRLTNSIPLPPPHKHPPIPTKPLHTYFTQSTSTYFNNYQESVELSLQDRTVRRKLLWKILTYYSHIHRRKRRREEEERKKRRRGQKR